MKHDIERLLKGQRELIGQAKLIEALLKAALK